MEEYPAVPTGMLNNKLVELRTWVEQRPLWDMMGWPTCAVGSFLEEYYPELLEEVETSSDPLVLLARFFETSKLHMAWIVYYPFYSLWSATPRDEVLSHISDAQNKVIVSSKMLGCFYGKDLFRELTRKP